MVVSIYPSVWKKLSMEDGEISIADANHKLPVKEKMIKVSPKKHANEFKAVSYLSFRLS